MDEQVKGVSAQNQTINEVLVDPIAEDPWLSNDSDGDGLTNRQEAMLGTDPYSADTDRDGVSDLEEVVLGTDLTSPNTERNESAERDDLPNTTNSNSAKQTEDIQSFAQEPSTPSLNNELEHNLQGQSQVPDLQPDISNNTSETKQPSFIDALYQRLRERSDLDVENITLSIYQGVSVLYQGNLHAVEVNILTSEQQDLLQKVLEDPTGLKGELTISVNDQMIFHVENGEIKLDQYRIAGNQRVAEAQGLSQAETTPQPDFDASAVYNHYRQEVQAGSQVPNEQAPANAYERIAQKVLNDGLSQEQAKQVLKQDPFHESLALSLGQQEAERYTGHLLNSLSSQATSGDRVTALENRIQSLESFNQHLSSQLQTLTEKLDKLSQSKAFHSQSSGLNRFFENVNESISNVWQATKNALRQQAGEVSLSIIDTAANLSTKYFGQETQDGIRVIDGKDRRIGLDQQGDILIVKAPDVQAASEFKRLSQGVNLGVPPSIQAKQIAQAALKEKFTPPQVHKILSELPKFKEINSSQGLNKANQFASVAIAAAQRQNIIDAQPKQTEQQKQNQHQA